MGIIKNIVYFIFVIFNLFIIEYSDVVPAEYNVIVALNTCLHIFAIFKSFSLLKYFKIPPTIFISCINYVTYGISPLFLKKDEFQLGDLNYDILYPLFFFFIIFYSLHFFIIFRKIKSVISLNKKVISNQINTIEQFRLFSYITLLICIVFYFVKLPISGLYEVLSLISLAFFLIGFLRGYNRLLENLIFISLICFLFLGNLTSGLIYSVVYFCLFVFSISIIYFVFNKRNIFFATLIVMIALLFSVLFSKVKMRYRAESGYQTSMIDRASFIFSLILESRNITYENNDVKSLKDGPLSRLSYPLSASSQTFLMTPAIVPYWEGSSYKVILVKWIPRFLWPDKPQEDMGQVFGHKYKFLADDNLTTSMNMPIIAEAYINFSYIGVYICAVILALLMSNLFLQTNLITNIFTLNVSDIISNITLALISVYYIQWESNLSMLLGKIFIIFVLRIILLKLNKLLNTKSNF